jgi:hypothetical protein
VIVIKANPGRIEKVSFTGRTPAERAIEAAVWPVIASVVDLMDRRLRRLSRNVRRALEQEEPLL